MDYHPNFFNETHILYIKTSYLKITKIYIIHFEVNVFYTYYFQNKSVSINLTLNSKASGEHKICFHKAFLQFCVSVEKMSIFWFVSKNAMTPASIGETFPSKIFKHERLKIHKFLHYHFIIILSLCLII